MLGIRERELYGERDYAALCGYIESYAEKSGTNVEIFQSNYEGAIVEKIQSALGSFDGIIINAAAYTHTSIAILDALKAVNLPACEVHLTDINEREDFRKISYCGLYCIGHFIGFGFEGYAKAIDFLNGELKK